MKLLLAFLTGAVMATPVWATETYDTEIIKQAELKWHFRSVVARSINDTTRVSGRLTAFNHIGLPHGHVDVAAFSPSGELITETTTEYKPALLTHRSKLNGGIRFSVEIGQALPADSVIKVAFHRNEPLPRANLVHTVNIAR